MRNDNDTREFVKDFYGSAARNPEDSLCCPTTYPSEETDHIPPEVIDRFYGCGSPVSMAGILPGETILDLGSGAGIDCFIAAKKTGPEGRVIGVDMTDDMLKVANGSKTAVSDNLGYDNVEFRKGILEQIPVENRSVDIVTSNCVINLSPEKRKVFSEIWRVLGDHGRVVISDIVSGSEIPDHIKNDKQLLGECIAGALTENQLLSQLEQTGFYGLQVLNKTYWKTIESIDFYSVTVRGYKYEKSSGCVYKGQYAAYMGPFKVIIDEEGHVFPRNQPVEVCTDTAQKLSRPPYSGMFTITETDGDAQESSTCSSNGNGACC